MEDRQNIILPSISVIILNWKNWRDTVDCLESLLQNDYQNFRVLVIDNHSQDESFEKLTEWSRNRDRITVLQTKENLGFAGGTNAGIKSALDNNTDFILLLNNDTIVTDNFLSSLVKAAEGEKADIVGCKILYYPDSRIWYCGGKMSWLRGGAYHPGKGRSNSTLTDKPFEVDFVTGCMMLIRREVIEKTGLLDESYFLYNEDADFCMKALKQGIKMTVTPSTVIYHKENSTDGGWKPYHIYYLIRNKLIFMNKYSPTIVTLWTFYVIVGFAGLVLSFKWLFQCRFDLISAYMKAMSDYSKGNIGKTACFHP